MRCCARPSVQLRSKSWSRHSERSPPFSFVFLVYCCITNDSHTTLKSLLYIPFCCCCCFMHCFTIDCIDSSVFLRFVSLCFDQSITLTRFQQTMYFFPCFRTIRYGGRLPKKKRLIILSPPSLPQTHFTTGEWASIIGAFGCSVVVGGSSVSRKLPEQQKKKTCTNQLPHNGNAYVMCVCVSVRYQKLCVHSVRDNQK